MNQNNLKIQNVPIVDYCLKCAKEEELNFSSIDLKLSRLIQSEHKHYVAPRVPLITALVLFAIVSILGSYNLYNNKQQQLAIEALEQERQNAFNPDYIYSTLVSSYERALEE